MERCVMLSIATQHFSGATVQCNSTKLAYKSDAGPARSSIFFLGTSTVPWQENHQRTEFPQNVNFWLCSLPPWTHRSALSCIWVSVQLSCAIKEVHKMRLAHLLQVSCMLSWPQSENIRSDGQLKTACYVKMHDSDNNSHRGTICEQNSVLCIVQHIIHGQWRMKWSIRISNYSPLTGSNMSLAAIRLQVGHEDVKALG